MHVFFHLLRNRRVGLAHRSGTATATQRFPLLFPTAHHYFISEPRVIICDLRGVAVRARIPLETSFGQARTAPKLRCVRRVPVRDSETESKAVPEAD
jgi:hypothetical protein